MLKICPSCDWHGPLPVKDVVYKFKLHVVWRTHVCPQCKSVTLTEERVLRMNRTHAYMR